MALHKITLLTKPHCEACDQAREIVEKLVTSHAMVLMEEIDILQNPDLHDQYKDAVPVILVDGVERFRQTVEAQKLAKLFYDEFGGRLIGF